MKKTLITLQARLSDKFGDNGLISAVVAKISENILIIENWVMSCRVFQLQVEHAMLNRLVQKAREKTSSLFKVCTSQLKKIPMYLNFIPILDLFLKKS